MEGAGISSHYGGGGGGSSFHWAARMTIVMVGNKYAGIVIPPSFLNPFIRKGVNREIFRKKVRKDTV
jgi:hypothetical protein